MIDYAAAGDLLEAYGRAWEAFDGDAWVAIFTDEAEYHEDPFGAPLVGHNALRAYLLDASASQRDVEFTVERHWVSGDTILAAWHATFTRRASGQLVRMAGFATAEVAPDGRISRFREWTRYGPEGRG
jgi:ketosteroid isomerase-like protein